MTKTELQRQTGLSSSTIAKIGKNMDISMNALRIIAEVLDCNIENLVTFENIYKENNNRWGNNNVKNR